jgi:hypothetical protein
MAFVEMAGSSCTHCNSARSDPIPIPILTSTESTCDKLRCNYSLSPVDVAEVRDSIAEAQVELAKFDKEIARLKSMVNHLIEKRETLDRCIQQKQALLAPIRRIPHELLSRFIELSLPVGWDDMGRSMGVLPHSQVCSHWRNVALSMHTLWCRISTKLPCRESQIAAVQTRLMRSGNYPLTVTVRQQDRKLTWGEVEIVMNMIVQQSSRWRHVELSLAPQIYQRLPTIRGHLPCLETLVLRALAGISNIDYWRHLDLDIFSAAPKLRTLHICDHILMSQKIPLPWTQITDLSLSPSVALSRVLTVLRQCPSIVSCAVTIKPVDDGVPEQIPSQSSIILDRLHTLRVQAHSDTSLTDLNATTLFSSITIPAVNTITLTRTKVTDSFVAMLSRSACLIQTLEFWHTDTDEELVIQVLLLMPCLTSFTHVTKTTIWRDHGMTYQNPGPCLVPMLKRLHLGFSNSSAIDTSTPEMIGADKLLDMIESRWRIPSTHVSSNGTVSRLESVRISGLRCQDEVFTRLRRLRTEGLDLKLI